MDYKKSLRILFISTLFIFFTVKSQAQLRVKYSTYEEKKFRDMRYGWFKPKNFSAKKTYPLIVYLHGSRDTVSRDIMWYNDTIQNPNPCFVLTPKCEVADMGWGNTWQNKHSAATSNTLALVDSLLQIYPIDPSKLYIYGISMGGFGVFSILSKEKEKFAAAFAICGGSNTNAAGDLAGTPLWIFHGADDDVVPVALSSDVYKKMLTIGATKVRYTEYPGVKHNSWDPAQKEKTLPKWLFYQHKNLKTQKPAPVTSFTLTGQTNNNITLSWTDPSSEVWYYKLYKNGTHIADIDGDKNTYSGPLQVKNATATYRITVINYYFQESEPSKEIKVQTHE